MISRKAIQSRQFELHVRPEDRIAIVAEDTTRWYHWIMFFSLGIAATAAYYGPIVYSYAKLMLACCVAH